VSHDPIRLDDLARPDRCFTPLVGQCQGVQHELSALGSGSPLSYHLIRLDALTGFPYVRLSHDVGTALSCDITALQEGIQGFPCVTGALAVLVWATHQYRSGHASK
jgi:hypothetical protein